MMAFSTGLEFKLERDIRGRVIANGTLFNRVPGSETSWFPVFVTADSKAILTQANTAGGRTDQLGINSFQQVPRRPILVDANQQSQLGIGPTSQMVSIHGSSSVIKKRGDLKLLLGDTTSTQFNRSCVPESLFSISLSNNSTPLIGSMRAISPIYSDSPFYANQVSLSFELFTEAVLFSIPSSIQDQMDELLYDYDIDLAYPDGDESVISNCSAEVMSLYPTIVLSIEGDNRTNGTIVFSPDDYLRFDPVSCNCYFKYVVSTDPDTPILINPILFPGINVRFTNDAIQLCDARDD